MGLAKRRLEEHESRGWGDTEFAVCAACLIDEALVAAVIDCGGGETCSFCEGKAGTQPTAPLELVLDLIVSGIRFEYEDPIEQSAYDSEDGYLVRTWDAVDLLGQLEVSDRADVLVAIAGTIKQQLWCQRDPYAATPAEALQWGWQAFRRYVREQRRYTFLVPDPRTADGAGALAMHAVPAAITNAVASANLLATLPAGSGWWRARVDEHGRKFHDSSEIGTPPELYAKDNRMSPKGIGMFYGASTLEGAVGEVAGYASGTAVLSLGRFELTEAIKVVDLREVAEVPSLFDAAKRHLRAPVAFLHQFIDDISTPAAPADIQNLEYIATQIITEFLRYELPAELGKIDGVLWRSAKNRDVDVCALFIDYQEFVDAGYGPAGSRITLDPSSVTHRTLS